MLMFRPHTAHTALALLIGMLAAGAVQATPPGDQPPPSFGSATPVEQLQDMTGGTDTHENTLVNQNTNGTVDGNSNFSIGNGTNTVGGNAFSNAAGLSTTIQNSGNNVLIQNSTSVVIRMN